jgi:multidrug resistance efflux pump
VSQDLVRARRGIHNGADTYAEQAETALAAVVHENNELRAENARLTASIASTRAYLRGMNEGSLATVQNPGDDTIGHLTAAAYGAARVVAERTLGLLGGDR